MVRMTSVRAAEKRAWASAPRKCRVMPSCQSAEWRNRTTKTTLTTASDSDGDAVEHLFWGRFDHRPGWTEWSGVRRMDGRGDRPDLRLQDAELMATFWK